MPRSHKIGHTGWPPASPTDPGWAGQTEWAGGIAPEERRQRDSELTALDPRFPVALGADSPRFWEALRPWWQHSSAFAMAESERAGKQAGRGEETFVVPAPDPVTAPIPVIRVPVLRTYPEPPVWAADAALDASKFLAEPLEPLPEMAP